VVLISRARRCDKTAYVWALVNGDMFAVLFVHNNFWTAKSSRELRMSSVPWS
jgi:hypothetical protein